MDEYLEQEKQKDDYLGPLFDKINNHRAEAIVADIKYDFKPNGSLRCSTIRERLEEQDTAILCDKLLFFTMAFPQSRNRPFGASLEEWDEHEKRILGNCRSLAHLFSQEEENPNIPGNRWNKYIPPPFKWAHFGNYSSTLAGVILKRLGPL